MNDTNLPITGICIVSKATNVPTGYQCIRKTFDDPLKDADLMPDTLLQQKIRFLCITRIYPLANNSALVLEDIKLINERETPAPQYEPLSMTIDSGEKGTAKRTICVRLVERQAGMKCVSDIIFLCRSKRPPQFYTLIGDINGLQMCIKEGTIPTLRPPPPIPSSKPEPITPDPNHPNSFQKKSDEKEILDGIPFQINPKYMVSNRPGANEFSKSNSFPILSSYELEQNFYYNFNLEKASI